MRRNLPLLLSLALVACGEDTALDLRLAPDPNVTNTDDLVKRLQTLTLTLDSPQGLGYTQKRETGEVRLIDVDGDGKLELQATLEVKDLGRLPRVRIERGGLSAGLTLNLRVEGIDGSATVAMGGVQGTSFVEGSATTLTCPFNLLPRYRAPQVTQVFPSDGLQNLMVAGLGSVVVVFSKPMNSDSLKKAGVFTVSRLEGGQEIVAPAKLITVKSLGVGEDAPSMATYDFATDLQKGATYQVRVTSDALDTSGRKLDQVPMQEGAQPFSSQFSLSPTEPMTAACNPSCTQTWCSNGGKACASDDLVCNTQTRTCEPKPQVCTSCTKLTVCDPALGICVPDCRINGLGTAGGCAGSTGVCLASGLCGEK